MKKRFFINLAYNGADYCGWQIQPNDPTIQESIQTALSTLYNSEVKIVGCGRTDTGVHASDYYAHVDLPELFTVKNLTYKLNNMLPKSIAIKQVFPVAAEAHTRFDATSRSYVYKMCFFKDPFSIKTIYKYDQSGRPDFDLMNKAAALLLDYKEFFPFCKTHADNDTYKCSLSVSEWVKISDDEWHYKVTSDRFLRGMVRMIVGMTLNVGLGRMELEEVQAAMQNQTRLIRAWSVPANGLFLDDITYPYLNG